MPDTNDPDPLVNALREALSHLYDPTSTVPDVLARALGDVGADMVRAREMLLRAIDGMQPGPDVPGDTRAWRLYDILRLRYIEHLTQDETAQRLAITVRHLGREQNAAIEMLAQQLVAQEGAASIADTSGRLSGVSEQVEAEVAALGAHKQDAVASVLPALEEALALTKSWSARRGVTVRLASVDPNAAVIVHPSVLHQILIAVVSYLVRSLEGGTVDLSAEESASEVLLRAVARPAVVEPPAEWVAAELIETQGGSLETSIASDGTVLQIALPSTRSVKVLVLDDNPDLVHYYGLCLAGTIYRMVHLAEGRRVFEVLARERPGAIVLDLMLPDVDGWELLTQLHEHPASRGIPVIVCSVVHEEELALALGATACVNKPVRRQQLLAALDDAISLAASAGPPASANNVAPW
ncbi:MAG: response regulator [Anaerolineales bacterium]